MSAMEEFLEGLREIQPEVPASFTWAGDEYECSASGATKGGKLESFGFGVYEDLVIVVRVELFGDAQPQKEQLLVFNGRSYRIDHVMTAPADTFLRLTCKNASMGL